MHFLILWIHGCRLTFYFNHQDNFMRDQSGMRNKLRSLGLLIRFMDPYLFAHFELTDNGLSTPFLNLKKITCSAALDGLWYCLNASSAWIP
jgi:hypothetical protein